MKRHDQEQMLSLYDQWQTSGKSKTNFAISHGIRPTTFYYWTRKFEQAESGSASGFRRISIEEASFATGNPIAAIHYPSGTCLELYAPVQDMSSSGIELIKKLLE